MQTQSGGLQGRALPPQPQTGKTKPVSEKALHKCLSGCHGVDPSGSEFKGSIFKDDI